MITEQHTNGRDMIGLVFVFVFWVGVGLTVAWNTPASHDFVKEWWWAILIAILIVFIGLLWIPAIRAYIHRASTERRIGLTLFVVTPLLIVVVLAIVFMPADWQGFTIRAFFLVAVCLFPPILYYLFIKTRKFSLLNEFVTNIIQLGLVTRRWIPDEYSGSRVQESDDCFCKRLRTYLQKFEAVYGPLPKERFDYELEELQSVAGIGVEGTGVKAEQLPGQASVFTPETSIPVVATTLWVTLGWLLTLPPLPSMGPDNPSWLFALDPEKMPVQFAFLGAYFFSAQMLFRRYVRRDLRANAYVSISLRIILSVIAAWVAIAIVKTAPEIFPNWPEITKNGQLVLAFAIGAFPPVIWQLVQAAVKKITFSGLLLPSLQSQMPISDLNGLTIWHQTRLEEEDIENVPNMASADIVELMLNTRLPPHRIVDWVDQAILYTSLGPEPKKKNGDTDSAREALRRHGIYTATALVQTYDASETAGDRASFEAILAGQGRSPIPALVVAVCTNPNFDLVRTWRGLPPCELFGMRAKQQASDARGSVRCDQRALCKVAPQTMLTLTLRNAQTRNSKRKKKVGNHR